MDLRKQLALVCVPLLLCAGCRKPDAGNPIVRDVTVAQWGQSRYLIYLPVYLAQNEGFFRNHHIDTHLKFSGNDDQVFASVVRGDAQFGVGDPVFTAISTQRGLPGLEVASIVGKVALWGVARKGAKPINTPQDLAGLRIGTFPKPSTTYTLLADTLKNSHVKAQIVEAQIGSELALLESQKVDVVFLLEPDASLAESKGYTIVLNLPHLWGDFAFTGLTTTQEYAQKHPDITSDMAAAIDDAIRFAHEHPDLAVADAQKLFPNISPAVVQEAVQRMVTDETLPASGAVDKNGWLRAVQVRREVGDISGTSDYLECLWRGK